jgi:hypothetical protein
MHHLLGWALPILVSLLIIQSAVDALNTRAAEIQAMENGADPPREATH